MADNILAQHQKQCDHRYVQWAWLAGILVVVTMTAGGAGWKANGIINDVRSETKMLADSVIARETRNVEERMRMRTEIDSIKKYIGALDTLRKWMPRVEYTVDKIYNIVRSNDG